MHMAFFTLFFIGFSAINIILLNLYSFFKEGKDTKTKNTINLFFIPIGIIIVGEIIVFLVYLFLYILSSMCNLYYMYY